MEIRATSIDFSLPLSGSGPRQASQTVVFPRPVLRAVAGLSGYTVAYSGSDHHVGQMEIKLDTTINDNTVTVNGTLGLRDWSGNWDDEYDGLIGVAVLADLESPTGPPPRPDLLVTGMELNQAVQFFRSSSYLDPGHVMPDNAIWLVARKNTGVRVYVDYEAGIIQPQITNLTGSLVVESANTTVTLQPINPGGAISPGRDSNINMAVANQTLNFMIPAALCVDVLTVTCEVWDQNDPTKRPSAQFIGTLTFTPVQPLTLYLVGVGYTAVTPNLPAPTQSAISNSLVQLIKTYPVGDVIQTGYTTLSFGETVTGNVANGCGSGFNDLLDRLNDLRGSSPDIHLGSLPGGIVETPGNSIGGCAPQPGRAAAVFVDIPGDVPHEIGHDLGRGHAPCTGGRCNPPPANVDPNYPQYGTFPSDSIGVFGFDATTNTVFNPASTFDFMSYSFPQWISPYTYNGLRGSNFGAVGGPSPGASPHLRSGVDVMILFLGLTITRDRKVTRRHSFHFPAPSFGQAGCGCETQFSAEFLDAHREVLACVPLSSNCSHSDCNCWPKVIRNDIPFPQGARWLLVWEGDKMIYEEEIPDPPVVLIEGAETQKDGVLLRWKSDQDNLWYLVHWLDRTVDDWRGVAPRQQETSLMIPRRLFIDSPELEVRVLATSGIATGVAQTKVNLDDYQPGNAHIGLLEVDVEGAKPVRMPNVIRSVITDSSGRQLNGNRTVWYGNDGVELGRGDQLDLRRLTRGQHTIRAVVSGLGDRTLTRSWLVERTNEGFLLYQEINDPQPSRDAEQHSHLHPAPPAGEE